MTYLFWLTIFALLFSFGYPSVLRSFKCFFCLFWVYFCYTFVTLVYFFCFLVLRRILTLVKVLFWLRNWTFFTELRGVNVFRIQIFFSVRTEDVLFISKYNIQFSWCICCGSIFSLVQIFFSFVSNSLSCYYHTLAYPKTKEKKIWTKDKIEPQHIYQSRIVRETKKLTSKLLKRKMQHKKNMA